MERQFYWPSLKRDVGKIVAQSSLVNQLNKENKTSAFTHPFPFLNDHGKMLTWILF